MLTYSPMNYIILDLEWNQSPKGKEGENPKIPFEIIEIGAVKLNEQGEIIDRFSRLVKPIVYKELHHITKDLTGFTIEELRKGDHFKTVANDFFEWCGDDYKFCTWGSLDITELFINMRYYYIKLPTPPVFYYDLQKIFNIIYENGDRTARSLEYAVDYLKIDIDNNFHRAYYDALYTAYVFQKLDLDIIHKYYSVDYFQIPRTKEEELTIIYDTYSKYVSMPYDNKTDAMKDKTVTSTICYKCGKRTRKKIRWFSDNSKIYYALSNCPEHGLIEGRIKMKKISGERYFIIKILHFTDEKGAARIKSRQLEIRAKRRKKRQAGK